MPRREGPPVLQLLEEPSGCFLPAALLLHSADFTASLWAPQAGGPPLCGNSSVLCQFSEALLIPRGVSAGWKYRASRPVCLTQEQHIVWAQQASPGIDPSQGPLESLWFSLRVYIRGRGEYKGGEQQSTRQHFRIPRQYHFLEALTLFKKKAYKPAFPGEAPEPATPPSPGSAARLGQHRDARRPSQASWPMSAPLLPHSPPLQSSALSRSLSMELEAALPSGLEFLPAWCSPLLKNKDLRLGHGVCAAETPPTPEWGQGALCLQATSLRTQSPPPVGRPADGGAGHGSWAVPDSRISVLVAAGLSVVVVEAVVAVASVVAAVVGATGGTVGTVVASVVAAVAGASVLLTVRGTPTVVGGDVGGAKGKCKIAASGRSGWTHGPACKAGSPRDRWS